MILGLILLWSLCSVYITYLFHKKGMKVAEIAYLILHTYILLWTLLIFIVDAVNFGFAAASTSTDIILGGDMAASFEYFAEAIYAMPVALAGAVEVVAILIFSTVAIVLAVSGVRAAKHVINLLRHRKAAFAGVRPDRRIIRFAPVALDIDRRKLCCRANC